MAFGHFMNLGLSHLQRTHQAPPFDYHDVPVGRENGIDYIRLVELTTSTQWHGGLSCRLDRYPLGAGTPPFSALSYTWGDPNNKATIQCNDSSLEITRSLYIALDALKRHHPRVMTQYLWADGICINQSKQSEEKPQQIPLMAELYRRASQVIVWLGEIKPSVKPNDMSWQEFAGPSDVENAMPAIRKFATAHLTRRGALASAFSEYDWMMLGFSSGNELRLQMRALYRLLYRWWFNRVWTIQEYVVARSVVILCGHHQILEADMMNACAFLASSQASLGIADWSKNPLIMLQGLKSEQNAQAKPPLLNLLAHFRHRDATDSRDKIYAVLDLASDSKGGLGGLDINVRTDISDGELYRAVAIKFLCRDESLDIVTLAGRYQIATQISRETPEGRQRHASRPQLPSWVPDWSLPDSTVSIQMLEEKKMLRSPTSYSLGAFSGAVEQPAYMFPLEQEPTQFRASGDSKYNFDIVAPGLAGLRVRGIIVDSIDHMGVWSDEYQHVPAQWWLDRPASDLIAEAIRAIGRVSNWLEITGAESGRMYYTGENVLDAFWKTMKCGHFPQGLPEERQRFMEFYNVYRSGFALYRSLALQPWWQVSSSCPSSS
jgi:hypothetical protein